MLLSTDKTNTSSDSGKRDANETVSRGEGIGRSDDLVELRKLILNDVPGGGGSFEDERQEVATILECRSGSGIAGNCRDEDSSSIADSEVNATKSQKIPSSSSAGGLLWTASTAKISFGKFVSSAIRRVPWNNQHSEEEKYQSSVGRYSKGDWKASSRQGAVEDETATAATESTQTLLPLCGMTQTNEFKHDKRLDYDDCHVYTGGTSIHSPNVLDYEDIGAFTKSATEPITSNLSPPDVSEFKEKITQRVVDFWSDNLIREAFSSPSKKSAAIAKWFKDSLDSYYTRALGPHVTSTMVSGPTIALIALSEEISVERF